ncbi:MAG: UdgX family uracil-DNA binding protein [Cryobacterium sp.]|nr:UdgX family uracil-DNA binding protein [Oligoflexia bacterium]
MVIEKKFSDWRLKARGLLNENIPPDSIFWKEETDDQSELPGLFSNRTESIADAQPGLFLLGGDFSSTPNPKKIEHRVPKEFLGLAEYASSHRSPSRWALLYRILWRLAHEDPHLLKISIDPDVAELDSLVRQVRKDMHKMKAFVRFREVAEAEGPHFIAWHRPDHSIVPLVAPFFARRFAAMRWTILTDELSVRWDGKSLEYLPGCPRSEAPTEDAIEEVWKTYYASTFNPARIKLRMMKKEMAVRYWDTMPETAVIRDLLRDSTRRLDEFFESQARSAKEWFPKLPEQDFTLSTLRESAKDCRACGICEGATQTVFGEGNERAKIVFVGEQPGDSEDRAGRPFIGPAGELLNEVLQTVGIDRNVTYVTNAVKHFKWIRQGKIRLHQKPISSEVTACQPWLRAELELIKPRVLVLLGATAAQSIIGKSVRLEEMRGRFFPTVHSANTFITTHPAALLRITDPDERKKHEARFIDEMAVIRAALDSLDQPEAEVSSTLLER